LKVLVFVEFKFEILRTTCNEFENECTLLTTTNENDLNDFTKKQEEISDEQAKLVELTQIVEQKGIKDNLFFFTLSKTK
jgi:hypothetical protein